MKDSFDKKDKKDMFTVGDLVLRWDARKDEKGKHGMFENLWIGPFSVIKILWNNTFVLQNLKGEEIAGPVNGHFLKFLHILKDKVLLYIVTVYIIWLQIRLQPNKTEMTLAGF